MKHLFSILFGVMSLGLFAQQTINATEAHFEIDGSTSREELAALNNELYANGFKFVYQPNMAPDRTLHGLTFTISANEGQLIGEGSHSKLNYKGAKITVDINKTTNHVEISYAGQR